MRPFLNPSHEWMRAANLEWHRLELLRPVEDRDPEWVWRPDFVFDHPGMVFCEEYRQLHPEHRPGVHALFPQRTARQRAQEVDRWWMLCDQHGVPRTDLPGDEGVQVPRARVAPRLRERDEPPRPHNREYLGRYRELDLAKAPQGLFIPRDVKLPPFKVEYDSLEQITTKLQQTCILIKDMPYTVARTIEKEDGTFALLVQDVNNQLSWVNYRDVQDCRGIAPGYVNREGAAYWVYRLPERQNSQGMCHRNTSYRKAGENRNNAAHPEWLVATLSQRKDVKYVPTLVELFENGALHSLRLSNNIALYQSKKRGASVGVEYRGRPLGLIVYENHIKVFDEHDLTPSWILKDVMDVGLRMGA